MTVAFEYLLFLYLPALALCGVFYGAGRATTHKGVSQWLRVSALIWLGLLWAVFSLLLMVHETCTGNFIYGYRDCSILSTGLADRSFVVFALTVCIGVLYGTVLAVSASVIEFRHRRARIRTN